METSAECICCKEVDQTLSKIEEGESSELNCITLHEGFQSVCLDVWVLQAAYHTYRQHYGGDHRPVHE